MRMQDDIPHPHGNINHFTKNGGEQQTTTASPGGREEQERQRQAILYVFYVL